MKSMSNDELTKHAIRTSADMLELNEKIDHVISVQEAHTERFVSIDERFVGIDKRFVSIDERFDRIENRLERVETRLDRVEIRLDGLEQRLDRVEERLEAHIAVSEDHFRRTDANFLEIRDLLGKLVARGA